MKKYTVLLVYLIVLLLAPSAKAQQGCGNTLNSNSQICQQIAAGQLSSAWTVINRHGEYAQGESECNIPSAITVAGGSLNITTTATAYTCGDFNPDGTVRTAASSFPYSTGDIQWKSFSFKYGTVTIKYKISPFNTDLWPAWWFLGTNCQQTNPLSGDVGFGGCPQFGTTGYTELDQIECFEFLGRCEVHVHNQADPDCSSGFTPTAGATNTSVMVWTPTSVTFSNNGSQILTCTNLVTANPMFMIIQTQTGGNAGTPNNSALPSTNSTFSVVVQDASNNVIFSDNFSSVPPALYFTDLTVGPNTGNSDTTFSSGNGAYVTLYGDNLGVIQGSSTVTWNGQNCLNVIPAKNNYLGWGSPHLWYQEIIVQITSACTPGTGNFVVTNAAGSSNGLPFTVNPIGTNHIYYAALGGSDSNPGTFQSPFLNGPHCMGSGDTTSVERAGDVCYVENGDNITGTNGFASLTPNAFAGTATAPIAFVTYPGASVTIGSDTQDKGLEDCVGLVPQCNTVAQQYLTIAGFTVHGVSYGVSIQGQNNRIVALNVQCPNSPNGDNLGCFNTINNNQTVLGNEVSNTGMNLAPGGTCGKLCHSMYIGYPPGSEGVNFEIGWNSSHDVNGGRTYQFYNGTNAGTNINFHDNMGYNNVGVDGVTIDADAGSGYVNIYNNVIFNVCNNPDEGGSCTCLYLQNTAGAPTVPEQVYNNTFGPGCSHNNSTSYGLFSPNVKVNANNNIFYATISGEPYIATSCSGCAANLTGANNIWFGGTGVPTQTTNNITTQPAFISLTGCANAQGLNAGAVGCNLSPMSSTSSQVGKGTAATFSQKDITGQYRPNPPSIGAYEFTAGPAPTGNQFTGNCTENLTTTAALGERGQFVRSASVTQTTTDALAPGSNKRACQP